MARVAPKDKVASYMSLAALPMFIAKPINGIIGGLLVAYLDVYKRQAPSYAGSP